MSKAVVEFFGALMSSTAVICRSPSKVKELVSSANELYATFYQLVGAGARRLEGTKMDLQRRIADSIMFPYYEDQIRFATLSLDGVGATAYGDCSIVVKDIAISERATVFEENSVLFCEKLELGVASPLPPGYRATWQDRAMLATAKLEPWIGSATNATEFPAILIGGTGQDFVEVHIFGALDRGSIERIVARKPKGRPTESSWRRLIAIRLWRFCSEGAHFWTGWNRHADRRRGVFVDRSAFLRVGPSRCPGCRMPAG